ncbi:stalk domain-containing protein [Paenibacillus xylanilyticus]|uniref:Copper amine oxidase-like N-terminal domain-containing protein n=1 Tax=Paenibacillus xylanilyticus TaxID=248903 RepID=A0A7Y6ETJ1_9BACL|nr:stalk domain-containing protein [Paenibacillus xylanilyticus]NUU74606.1 hypothetical protein [Paenibacillus xylanilyticus]
MTIRRMAVLLSISTVLLTTACSAPNIQQVFAQEDAPVHIFIDGVSQELAGSKPFKIGEITMVPVRKILEPLGAEIKYQDNTMDALIKIQNGQEIIVHSGSGVGENAGSRYILFNGERKDMGSPAVLINKETFVPISFVETIGGTVHWISMGQTVDVNLPELNEVTTQDVRIFTNDGWAIPGNSGMKINWGSKYVGQMNQSDKPNGQGTLLSQKLDIVYTGTWLNGLPNGEGTVNLSSDGKIKIKGFFNKGEIVSGVLSANGSAFFEGTFGRQSLKEGALILPDKRVFKGTISDDQKIGVGSLTNSEGKVLYEGKIGFSGTIVTNDFSYQRLEG